MGLRWMLWLRGLAFTVLVPAIVGLYLPCAIASSHDQSAGAAWYAGWTMVVVGASIYFACLGQFLRAGGTPAIFFARHLRLLIGEEPMSLVSG